ncbi:MAG: Rrf2 family transcriptional regulator [Bryobacteraceae bacterium]|nr:Rrf2 family transcriptional regulator [Bryobacteraceae bacterium]
MQLSRQSDLALRVLMYAAQREEASVTIAEIADFHRVSKNHLMVVVNRLARAGYLDTVRGRGGGLHLAKPPGEIRVGDVLRVAESNFAIVECLGAGNTCRITRSCGLKGALRQAMESFFKTLDSYTLADVAGKSLVRLG